MTAKQDDLPILAFHDAAAFERWIAAPTDTRGLWLRIAKANTGIATVTYDQALDVALCHGWIDGQKRAFDSQYFLQRFTPRRTRSLWSKRNVDKATQLIAAGRMQPAGQREIDAAKADGRWDQAYAGAASREVPAELADALAKSTKARVFFDTLSSANRYAFCWRVQTAKRAETRLARAATFIAMMERGETLH